MLFIVIAMVVIVAVAGLVVAFVAFPHRGKALPGAPRLGEAMGTAVDAMPTLDAEPREGTGTGSGEGEHRTGSREPGAHL